MLSYVPLWLSFSLKFLDLLTMFLHFMCKSTLPTYVYMHPMRVWCPGTGVTDVVNFPMWVLEIKPELSARTRTSVRNC